MFMELYREEKREEGDRGSQEDKRGIKRRETDPASNQFPKCSPPSETYRDSQSWVEKRRGRVETEKRKEGVRGDPNEMRWNQKRREQASQ